MTEINWDEFKNRKNGDSKPVLRVATVGDFSIVKFINEGTLVEENVLKKAGAKFPRDSYVFEVLHEGTEKNFWVSKTAYSTMEQIFELKEKNGGFLAGAKARILRISNDPKETNYEIRPA